MTEGLFELDRTGSGKIRVNAISVANFAGLLGLLATALASWNGMNTKVDTMAIRIENATREVSQIRSDVQTALLARDGETRELRGKVEQIGNRMVAVETVLQRMERKLDDNPH